MFTKSASSTACSAESGRLAMNRERARIVVHGAVQGVGFRPFVYRLAKELQLDGWVSNSAEGVFIEVEGVPDFLNQFLLRLEKEKPPRAVLQSLETSFLDPTQHRGFEIRESDASGKKTALVLPDIATCADCLRDVFSPGNRRFRYPFTNCTNCGPRFSIIETVPYDRANTAMKRFTMCPECDREYHDPLDRRFQAQPNACPLCGPHLQLLNVSGDELATGDDALATAARAVCDGRILALKGLGGFQLIVAASSDASVRRLRERKHREEKPLALLFPSLKAVREACQVSELEERLLLSPESPIVLLSKKTDGGAVELATSVAPHNPNLGVMLPYTPLHHLLMRELAQPVVATSGNLSDEPICIDEYEALARLRDIADIFLVHDRPIVRHVDDSIARIMCGRELVLRRARGYAPLPITIRSSRHDPQPAILSLGAHLKNTVGLKIGDNVFLSQHLGDLETEQAFAAFRRAAADLPRLYDVTVDIVACDMHPEYLSTKCATEFPAKKVSVQHHWAHVVACMAENEIDAPALGVAWDGSGYGLDGTVWGGEFLLARDDSSFERVAHLRPFRLPGGDQAVKEPRRCALGVLHELFGEKCWDETGLPAAFTVQELSILRTILARNVNAPLTSSVGRLFDAVSGLLGRTQPVSFEGQAAMELEFVADAQVNDAYPLVLTDKTPMVIDWEPAIHAILRDIKSGEPRGAISARFHNMLVQSIVAVAQKIGERNVILTGGCFQNCFLIERVVQQLRAMNFHPIWHQHVPPNDGGIALGQAVAASWIQ